MSRTSRRIVFQPPSLVPGDAGETERQRPPAAPQVPPPDGDADVRKLATLLEVSQTLAGTLNLQVSHHPARGGVPAPARGPEPAGGAAGELRVGGGAGVGDG